MKTGLSPKLSSILTPTMPNQFIVGFSAPVPTLGVDTYFGLWGGTPQLADGPDVHSYLPADCTLLAIACELDANPGHGSPFVGGVVIDGVQGSPDFGLATGQHQILNTGFSVLVEAGQDLGFYVHPPALCNATKMNVTMLIQIG